MTKTGVCNLFGVVLFIMSFQFVLQDAIVSDSHPNWTQINKEKDKPHKQQVMYPITAAGSSQPSEKVGEHQSIKRNPFLNRVHRSTSPDLLTSQFEQICVNIGSQPCTCYYPDHRDVTRFELSTDEITMNASAEVNGTGPANCTDIRNLGHYLNGFYMVRFNNKQAKATYCEFQQAEKGNQNDTKIIEKFLKQDINSESLRGFKYCGDSRINVTGCTFLYSDNPDAPITFEIIKVGNNTENVYINFSIGEPRGCEDLRSIGYTLKGFYLVRLNSLKVKTVYCDFLPMISDDKNNAKTKRSIVQNRTKSRFCSKIGSQPCTCYYHSKFPKTLQLELSSDETTRNASIENGTGPASCEDLQVIGHSLNGFYIVRSVDKTMKTVFCEFFQLNKATTTIQPTITKSSQQIEHAISITIQSNIETPKPTQTTKNGTVELLKNTERTPTSLKQDQTTIQSTLKSDLKTQQSTPISELLGVTLKFSKQIPLNHVDGKSYLLTNKHGKCLAVETNATKKPAENGAKLMQANCSSLEKGQLWKWNRKFELLCNDWNKCLSVPFNLNFGSRAYFVFHWDIEQSNEVVLKKWAVKDNAQFLHMGYCLSVEGNSGAHGVSAMTELCNTDNKGQIWSFAWY